MKIKCVDNYGCSYLTVGKVYHVISKSDGCFEIMDDTGEIVYTRVPGLLHGKFEVVEE